MLESHFEALELKLLTESLIASNTGHTLHKGTPREAFIENFLKEHLAESVAVGRGEIIDAFSKPNEKRPQNDIVIYKRNYPKLNIGGGISAFFAESVIATIEVKSVLDKKAISQSVKAARQIKQLKRHFFSDRPGDGEPPAILNFVVAYDGPENMTTPYKWICKVYQEQGIKYPDFGLSISQRITTPSPALGVCRRTPLEGMRGKLEG